MLYYHETAHKTSEMCFRNIDSAKTRSLMYGRSCAPKNYSFLIEKDARLRKMLLVFLLHL